MCVPLVYMSEYALIKTGSDEMTRAQSVYLVCVVGFMTGVGRIVSLIVYKVNESNPKNRVFSYTLTLLLNGVNLIVATYLCDTVFSFMVFAAAFGALIGKNTNV